MARISDLINHALRWEQPSGWKQEYELHAGDYVVGRLDFASSWKSVAVASSTEGEWTFDRPGFWQRRMVVRSTSAVDDLASFQNNFWKGGGILTLPDGRVIQAVTNFWTTQYHLFNEAGQPLLSYTGISGFMRSSCDLQIHPSARELPELPWLVPFGWYLVVMMKRDASTAAAA